MDSAQLGFMQGYIRKEAASATESLIRAMSPGVHLTPGEPSRLRFKNDNLGLAVNREDLPGMTFGSDVGESAHPYNDDMAKLAETSEDEDNEEGGEEINRDRKPDIPVRKQEQCQEDKEAALAFLSKTAKKKSKKDAKMGYVMGEFKDGKLRSGSKDGPVVTDRKQAIAIAMSESDKVAADERVQTLKKHFQKKAALSALARTKVPKKEFGLPGKAEGAGEKKESGNYPMPDKKHARSALALMHNASPEEQKQIKAKADKVLNA